jgi:hypothetical protein
LDCEGKRKRKMMAKIPKAQRKALEEGEVG